MRRGSFDGSCTSFTVVNRSSSEAKGEESCSAGIVARCGHLEDYLLCYREAGRSRGSAVGGYLVVWSRGLSLLIADD